MSEILAVETEPAKPAQTSAPSTEPTGWMPLTDELRNNAPESVKNLLEAKKWTTIEDAFKGYNELEKFTGIGKHLVIPEADDVEGWNNVWNQCGRPETHDKYAFDYEGDIKVSDELVGQFKQFAHGLGLTQRQFNDVVKFQLDAVGAQTEAYNAQLEVSKEENVVKLKGKFGEVDYENKIKGARIIADKLGIYEMLEAKGLASDFDIISMLDTIASRTAEDVITPQPPTPPAKTPQERLEEIKKNPAYMDKFHQDHKKIMVEYMQVNNDIANSGQARAPRR